MYIVIIAVAILLEGFFSGSEIAIVSLNRIRLRILAEAKDKRAVLIHNMLKDPNRLLGTTLVGTNLAVVIASSFCTEFIYTTYGIKTEWVTTAVLTPFVLIFGEFVPKAIFAQTGHGTTFSLGFLLKFFWNLFYPVVWVINIIVKIILRIVMGSPITDKKSPFVTKEEIKYLIIESEKEGEIDQYERSMIYKIFDFGRKKVKDIIAGIDKLAYLSDTDTIEALLKKALESKYSRFPIRSQSGEFIGIVNILDVVYQEDRSRPLSEFIRPIECISAGMDIDNALFYLKSKKQSLAIAGDSKSAPVGFFTMEDLLEELVGEI